MNFKEYSLDAAKSIIEAITKAKKLEGEGNFKVIASSESIDRHGEKILVKAWELDRYKANPVILWGHDYYSLPIGVATNVYVENDQLIAEGVFAKSEFAQEVRALYDQGILKAVSVGFIPLEREANVITRAELLEISFVPVPANQDALSLEKIAKIETMLKTIPSENQLDLAVVEAEMKSLLSAIQGEPTEEHTKSYEALSEQYKQLKKDVPEMKAYTQYELDQMFPALKEEGGSQETVSGLFNALKQDVAAMFDSFERSISPDAVARSREKSGRVLSTKNRTLVQEAVRILGELLEATEPDKDDVEKSVRDLIKNLQGLDKSVEQGILQAKGMLKTL